VSEIEGFLARWSRRKAAARHRRPAADPSDGGAAAPAERPPDATQVAAPALPHPATLDAGSDFAAFMAPAVPDALRQEALRRLWRVDPVFSMLDGMNEYDEDFTGGGAAGIVRTAYRIGRGMVEDAEPAEAAPPESDGGGEATADGHSRFFAGG
jgi:Protein of unknown function (DUF3306)